MTLSQMVVDSVDNNVESMQLAPGINGFHLEPRCRVCRDDELRKKVNDMLATGASYAMVLRALGEEKDTPGKGDRVTIDSVRNHAARHFPVQQVARATYREILERRAKENSVDFIEGVATAITPMALLETVKHHLGRHQLHHADGARNSSAFFSNKTLPLEASIRIAATSGRENSGGGNCPARSIARTCVPLRVTWLSGSWLHVLREAIA